MTLAEEKWFTRTALLLGEAGVKKLMDSTVAVFGLGGVGSFVAEGLARAGVGHLVLVDSDVVSVSNINRQLPATTETIGRRKTSVMRERILAIHPAASVELIDDFYLPENADQFFRQDYDYVVDAIDTVAGKIDLVLQCVKRGIPIVSSMGAGNKLDPTRFEVADIYRTSVDPLARVMRKKLKEHGVSGLKVVYSTEPPVARFSDCVGSVPFVPSVAGLILAGEVVKDLCGDLRESLQN